MTLEDVLVGGLEPRVVEIAEYDAAWMQRYAIARERIATALGAAALQIEHIGSTAVPGLAAKPIVDVLVVVERPAAPEHEAALTAVGYVLRVREPQHRMFRTPERDVHVHLWPAGSIEIERYLKLRDHLRANDEDREAYAALKRELAARGEWRDTNDYAEAKGPFIEGVLERIGAPRRDG